MRAEISRGFVTSRKREKKNMSVRRIHVCVLTIVMILNAPSLLGITIPQIDVLISELFGVEQE